MPPCCPHDVRGKIAELTGGYWGFSVFAEGVLPLFSGGMRTNKQENKQQGSADGGRSPARELAGETPAPQFAEIKALLGELAAETEEWKQAAGGSITEVMAGWVAAQYLLAVRAELAARPTGPERFELLRQAAGDVAALQRGNQRAARLQLDREKLELEREKHRQAVAAAQPKPRKEVDYTRPLTDVERLAIMDKVDEIMGLK